MTNQHTCSEDECGRHCVWQDGKPVTSFHISFPDSSGIDADDQPCRCELHDDDPE